MATAIPMSMSQQTTLCATDGAINSHMQNDTAGNTNTASSRSEHNVKAIPARDSKYVGSGTKEDPYVVDWDLGDPENPYNWSKPRKWAITAQLATATFTVAFCSSCYTGGLALMSAELHLSETVAVLGVSLYVLGFGLGPLLFAPLSELYGRRIVFITTGFIFALFHLGGALGHNAAAILVTRLLAGIFGSAPLTNAGGALSDMWIARERGFASSLYSTAPWMGPVLGPIVGGYISETHLGWRFSFWVMFILSAWEEILYILITPETYGPVLLRRRARNLTKASGGAKVYVSKHNVGRSRTLRTILRRDMGRPFYFLITEPIVLLLALYIALAYATLYVFFAAFPIVFQRHRGFSEGEGGLAFLGIGLGNLLGLAMAPIQSKLYERALNRNDGKTIPEARLYVPIVGSIFLPLSLFWFAWTSDPPVHFIVPIIAGVPFGFAVSGIMQGLTQYLMDTYSILCASAIASTVVTRSVIAAVFPLITPTMYAHLGDAWACSVFAFLSTACMPVIFLFFKYGSWIRSRSRYALHDDDAAPHSAATEPPSRADVDEKKNTLSGEKAV